MKNEMPRSLTLEAAAKEGRPAAVSHDDPCGPVQNGQAIARVSV